MNEVLILTKWALAIPMAVWEPSTLQKLLLSVFGLVIIIVGIGLASRSNKAQYSETARVGFNVIMAIIVIGLGAGAIAFATFGKAILAFLGISFE